jgi:hypothetical protein
MTCTIIFPAHSVRARTTITQTTRASSLLF